MTDLRRFVSLRLHSALVPALALVGLASPAAAQASAAQIESDIAFARGLASQWSFVDLAEDVIRSVESGRLEDDQAANLALLRCEIYTVGARNERDPVKRDQLFEEALSCLKGYVESNPYAANRTDAETAYVEAAKLYSRSIRIALEDAIGEEAEALKARRVEVLTDGVQTTNALIESLAAISAEERTEAQTARWLELQLTKGQMYADISSAQGGDPYTKELAINTLSDLVFDAGEGTPFALRSYAALGDLYSGAGEFEDAAAYYEGVIEQVIPTDSGDREELLEWSQMPQPVKQRRFLFVELAMPGVLDSFLQLGEDEQALRFATYFWNLHRSEGLDLTAFGHDSLLQVARVMLNSDGYLGGDVTAGLAKWFATEEEMKAEFRARRQQSSAVDFALELANQVADDAPTNQTKNDAGKLIAEISERPGIEISPDQMFEAAMAKYRSEDYDGAERAVGDLLVRLDSMDAADRQLFGAKVYNLLGLVLRRANRDLESAMAFREASLNWDDPELNESNAKMYKSMIDSVARVEGNPSELVALQREAEDVVARKGPESSVSKINFNKGRRAEAAKNWEDAIAEYEKLQPGDEDYEQAYVNIGVCLFRNGQGGAALERFTNYLENIRTDAALATESPSMLARRKGASAAAEFYRGYIYSLAADRRFGQDGDVSGFARVIEHVDSFEDAYPEQDRLAAITMGNVTDAYAKLGESEKAKAKLEKMFELYPDDKQTAAAAVSVFKTFEERRKELEAEGADRESILAVARDMAEFLEISNTIDASPSYANLDRAGDLWYELGEWSKARDAYARVVAKFSQDAEYGDKVQTYVLPDMAWCMLQLREVNDARDLLEPLAMGVDKPTGRVVLYYAMSVCGWLDGGKAGVQQVPGAGGTEEQFEFITGKLTAIQRAGQTWTSCKWYEDKLMEMYAYYAWGEIDARKRETAKNLIDGTQPFIDNDSTFAVVDQFCSDEPDTPADVKARLGDGTLRARYRWLWERTR